MKKFPLLVALVILGSCAQSVEERRFVGTWTSTFTFFDTLTTTYVFGADGTIHVGYSDGTAAEDGTWSVEGSTLTLSFPGQTEPWEALYEFHDADTLQLTPTAGIGLILILTR